MNTRVTRNVLVSILAVALITGCGKKSDKIVDVNEDMTESEISQDEGYELEVVEGKGFSSWQEGYRTCLDGISCGCFFLICIDDDDVPELVIRGHGNCFIIDSYYEGTVFNTVLADFSYIEKSGLLCSDGGLQGLRHDNVYSFSKGRWKQIFEGVYYDRECNGEPVVDNKYRYFIDAEEVDEDTYYEELNEVYDTDNAISIYSCEELSYEELMEKLK